MTMSTRSANCARKQPTHTLARICVQNEEGQYCSSRQCRRRYRRNNELIRAQRRKDARETY